MKKYTIRTLEDTREIAKEILAGFVSGEDNAGDTMNNVILLQGDLGAGKTAFTKLLAEELGIEEIVVSPTFALLKVYKIFIANKYDLKFKRLVHVDLYRLEKVDRKQIINIGLQEYIDDAESLVLIEWPERMEQVIDNVIKLHFNILDNNKREVIII